MSGVIEVELTGGFANRMSKYAFARAYAERHGSVLRTNAWKGQQVFEIDDPPIKGFYPLRDTFYLEQWDGEVNIALIGEAHHQKNLIYTRADARRYFRFRPEILAVLSAVPAFEVAAHLRWGDFVNANGFVAITKESYLRACDQYGIDRAKLHFISEEEPIVVIGVEPGFTWNRRLTDDLPGLGFLPDFYALCKADILFRAASSFSFWAGVIGRHSRIFSPDLRGLPWEGEGRGFQDVPFVEGNHMPITWWTPEHSELHVPEK